MDDCLGSSEFDDADIYCDYYLETISLDKALAEERQRNGMYSEVFICFVIAIVR